MNTGGARFDYKIDDAGTAVVAARGFVTRRDVCTAQPPFEFVLHVRSAPRGVLVLDLDGVTGFEPGLPVAALNQLREEGYVPRVVVVSARLPTLRCVVPALGVLARDMRFEVAESHAAALVAARRHVLPVAPAVRPAPREHSGIAMTGHVAVPRGIRTA